MNDQSSLFSNVPNYILERLILPLGDLQNREIKIAEKNNFFDFKSIKNLLSDALL